MHSSTMASRADLALPSLRDRSAWLLALLLVLVPNLVLMFAMPFYVAIRPVSPLLYLSAGLISLRLKPVWTYPLFIIAGALDLIMIVAIAFHLPFGLAIESAQYMASIDIAASVFYLAVIAVFTLSALATAWLVNRHRTKLHSASLFPAVLATLLLMVVERQINLPYAKPADAAFESALTLNQIDASSISANGRNLLLVLVEGLGAYADPAMAQQLSARLKPAVETGRFELTEGLSNFKGSTTSAESRELCGKWGDHTDYLGGRAFDCLPAQLAKTGYQTISYHGFTETMFARDIWYPRVGFQERHFFETLSQDAVQFPQRCGSVFEGLCDRDFGPTIGNRLKQDPQTPKMVYWLTLNSHVPYVPKTPGSLGCATAEARIGNKRVCELTDIWADVFDAVASMASDPDLPPTDILVVGDHGTPLWERPAAVLFQPGKVQWYLLRSKRTPL
jgi:Sulfatase